MRSSGAGSDLGPACTCPAVVPPEGQFDPIVEEKCDLCPHGSAVPCSDLREGVIKGGSGCVRGSGCSLLT